MLRTMIKFCRKVKNIPLREMVKNLDDVEGKDPTFSGGSFCSPLRFCGVYFTHTAGVALHHR